MENTESALPTAQDKHSRQMSFLQALHKLRDEVCRIEEKHPGLNNGLAALCDEAIQSIRSTSPPGHTQDSPVSNHSIEPIPTTGKANPIVSTLDRTGHYLTLSLDKAGDGIIFVFEGLLKLGRRSNGNK